MQLRKCINNNPKLDLIPFSISMSSAAGRAAASALREFRLHLCQKSSASAGARAFVTEHYGAVKAANPGVPFLVRECSGITPRLWARYAYGQEASQDLSGKSAKEVMDAVKKFSAGVPS